jgi:hypothetical protein
MALECAAHRSRGRVPEPNRLVVRRRRHQLAVWREGDRPDRTRMALESTMRRIPGFFSVQGIFNAWMSLIPELLPNFTLPWTEYESSAICLEGSLFDY